eukprot:11154267-Lingulodinium_polyedra.AAC.1
MLPSPSDGRRAGDFPKGLKVQACPAQGPVEASCASFRVPRRHQLRLLGTMLTARGDSRAALEHRIMQAMA